MSALPIEVRVMTAIHGNDTSFATIDAYRSLSAAALNDLHLVRKATRRRRADELTLYACARNEQDFLEAFLVHYRRLGVDRFVIVDNGSRDRSRQILEAAEDVDLYTTETDFRLANYGMLWIDGLISQESMQARWLLVVDIDELLVYDQCDEYDLRRLIGFLEARDMKRLMAPMVDLYEIESGSRYFDAEPERIKTIEWGVLYQGGVRRRMNATSGISFSPCLTKHPLVFFDAQTAFANSHFPSPYDRNRPPCLGRLLHTKLLGDFAGQVAWALIENRYWNDSIGYRNYARWLGADLRYEGSRNYAGPQDLIDCGLMQPIGWS